MQDSRTIFQRINDITRSIGVLEPQKAPGGGIAFSYRGVDATVAHLSPLLAEHGVFAAPNVLSHLVTERESGARVIKTTQVEVKFVFYGELGDTIEVTTAGLADDFADRSTAQAMSVAYRIALLQLFHIPAFGKDPEETGQVVQDGRAAAPAAAPRGANAVERAKASATAKSSAGDGKLKEFQMEAKVLGGKLSKSSSDLNGAGTRLAEAEGVTDWFNNEIVMGKLVAELKTEAGE